MQLGGVQLKDGAYIFGFPKEWAAFEERHTEFLKAFEHLAGTINKVKVRTFTPKASPADETVFFLGSLVSEDFTEVWLMAGNGLGSGALKVLRGMYERTVTAAYISRFPEEAVRFWRFGAIARRRILNNARELFGLEDLRATLGDERYEEAETEYQEVIGEFQEPLCTPCNKFRTMPSWSKLSLPAMAKKAGFGLEHCYFNGYAVPTQQAHSTVLAIESRVKQKDEGVFTDESAQNVFGAMAILTAHVVMLKILRVENSYFSLGLDAEISQREAECKAAWPGIENDCGKGM